LHIASQISELNELLQRRTIRMSFPKTLEAQYTSWIQAQEKRATWIVLLLMCGIWSLFLVADIYRLTDSQRLIWGLPLFETVITIRTTVLLLLLISSAVIIKKYHSRHPKLVMVSYFMLTCMTSILSNIYHVDGVYRSALFPVVLIAPVLVLPVGAVFRQMMVLAICSMSVILGLYFLMVGVSDTITGMLIATLLIVFFSAIAGGYYKEKGYRSAFISFKLMELRSFTDPLTETGNRRYYREFGQRLLEDAVQNCKPLTFIIIDLDHFKSINDKYGHDQGDIVLIKVAECLKRVFHRPLDIVTRLGGEEFGVLLNSTDLIAAKVMIKKFASELNQISFEKGSVEFARKITASIGVVQLGSSETLDQLYSRADELMYEAKQNGRNRVTYQTASSEKTKVS